MPHLHSAQASYLQDLMKVWMYSWTSETLMLNFDGAFSIHNRDFKDFPISLQIYYNFSAISTVLANLHFNKHKCHRYLAYCINPYLTVCLGPLLLGFPTRNIYWNFNNLREHRVLKFAKFWEIHAAPILLKTEKSARCSRRRRAIDADAFFLAPETGSFFFFFVSVWRNRGLAKSVTAAEKKWPRYESFWRLRSNCTYGSFWRRSWRLLSSLSCQAGWLPEPAHRTLTRSPGS